MYELKIQFQSLTNGIYDSSSQWQLAFLKFLPVVSYFYIYLGEMLQKLDCQFYLN